MDLKKIYKNKTGGIVTNTVMGVGALVIAVIVILVVVGTVEEANLLTVNSTANTTVADMSLNFTTGISKISGKIPTILLIVAVVFLLGALVLLMKQARGMGIGGDSGSL